MERLWRGASALALWGAWAGGAMILLAAAMHAGWNAIISGGLALVALRAARKTQGSSSVSQ